MAKALTQGALDALKPGKKRREIADGKTAGLYFIIQTSGVRSWAFRYRFGGRARKLTLGSYPALGLAAARVEATKARAAVDAGRDPGTEKAEKRIAAAAADAPLDLVEAVCDGFIKRYAKVNMRRRSWMEAERIFRHDVKPAWGKRRLATISRGDINDLLDRVMDRAPTLANRLLGTLKTMGRWAVERGLVERNPFSDHRAPAPSTDRDRVLNEAELRALLLALKAEPYHQGQMVKMLALSAARRSEVSEMRWSEIDLDAKIWRLPRERAKNDTEHVVPLSDDAVSILQAAPRFDGSDFVFSSRGDHGVTKFDRFKRRIDASMAASLGHAPEHWTLHDLRRTAASGMAELGVAPHVIEACLNHRSGIIRGVARTYNRFAYTNEKAAAFQAWSRRLREIETGKSAPSNVVTLARA